MQSKTRTEHKEKYKNGKEQHKHHTHQPTAQTDQNRPHRIQSPTKKSINKIRVRKESSEKNINQQKTTRSQQKVKKNNTNAKGEPKKRQAIQQNNS